MEKFLAQKDTYSCGPIAIANALIWAGESVTKTKVEKIKKSCRCSFPSGTDRDDLILTILNEKKLDIPYSLKRNSSVKQIDSYLKCGYSVLVRYVFVVNKKNKVKIGGHFVLIVGKENGKYIVLNDRKGVVKTKLKKEKLKEYLKPVDVFGEKHHNFCFAIKKM